MKKGSKKNKNFKKKSAKETPVSAFPIDWFFFHPEEYSTAQLKEVFLQIPELDVECWPELQVLELTFPSKVYVDFEATDLDFEDETAQRFLAEHPARSCYLVSVEPVCNQPELDFLQTIATATGGLFVSDTPNMEHLILP